MEVIYAAILEAVSVAPMGVPNGVLYAHLQSILGANQWSLNLHSACINKLVGRGFMSQENHVLRITDIGRQMVDTAKRIAAGGK